MANHSLPTTTSLYTDFVSQMAARFNDLALDLDSVGTTPTNLPSGAVRWNAATFTWEKWNGTAWAARSTRYDININGSVGATTASTGAFTTLSSNSTTSLAAGTTIGGVAAVTISGTQTLTNKTLTLPVIASISNSGTITLPTGTRTLVATDTTDTLTNKTLTTPRFASGGFIADANGNESLEFVTVASAVNFAQLTNSATGAAVQLAAAGGDVNVSLNLVPKGTGTVQVSGAPVVTTTAAQTLTNKTLTTPVIASIVNTGTLTLPTSTDTLVGRSTTDTLANKTLTAPRFASGGFIADANGNEQLLFTTTASAVNELTVTNAAAGTAPSIATTGSDANINLDLVAKGTGVVRADGIEVVTISGTQTLTNKTWQGSAIAVLYGGTGATDAATACTNLGVPSTTGTGASGSWNINAATVTNGVYTTSDQTIAGIKTFSSTIVGSINGNAATVTNGVYTTGDQTIGGNKTWTGVQALNGTNIHSFGNVVSSYTGYYRLGGRGFRKLTTGHSIEIVNNASTAVTHTLADNGDFTATGNVTAYSDIRLKTDLTKISNALTKVNQLNGYTYTRLDSGERQTGVVAQEVQAVLPEAVIDGGEHLAVAYGNMVGLLIEAVKELTARVEELEGH